MKNHERLRITAVEIPIFEDLEESVKIWVTTVSGAKNARLPPCFGVVNREKFNFPLRQIMRVTGAATVDALVGKEIVADVIVDGGEITINNIRSCIMQNLNVKEGKNWFQVEECREGKSSTSGNEYWVLRVAVLPDPKSGRRTDLPTDSISVYFLKKFDWALENLNSIVQACGTDKPWKMYGKRFIADVVIKNDFVSFRKPRPYTEEEEPEESGINAPSEWPF